MSKWEMVIAAGGKDEWLERCRVPGGWLYKSTDALGENESFHVCLCFVPYTAVQHDAGAEQAFQDLTWGGGNVKQNR